MTKRLHKNRLFLTEDGNKNPVCITIIDTLILIKVFFKKFLKIQLRDFGFGKQKQEINF